MFFLEISRLCAARMRRETSRVSFLMCPFVSALCRLEWQRQSKREIDVIADPEKLRAVAVDAR